MYICENKKTMTEAIKQYQKQYQFENRERIKKYNKQWKLENKEHLKKYQLENKDKIKIYHKKYRLNNKEKIKEINKQHYLDNKDKIKEYRLDNKEHIEIYQKKYRLDNKDKINKCHNNRKKNDYLFRITCNIRTQISKALKNKGYTKKTNTYKILGCEYNVFAEWLGLNNYNEDSHLDHVVPISLADTEEEVLILNHYSNFQLLTSKENLAKGNRYIKNDNLQRVLNNHPQPSVVQEIVNRSNIEIKNP